MDSFPQVVSRGAAGPFGRSDPALRTRCSAFTLVELLVVMAGIALLAAMLLPALSTAKAETKRIACMNNLKQLSYCVTMYCADSDGRLPENTPGNFGGPGMTSWVCGDMSDPLQATNVTLIKQGKLFPYSKDTRIYHCPADASSLKYGSRLRSYSMNGWMGSRYMETRYRSQGFRTFVRDSELAVSSPSRLWMFIDEHERSIDDAWFLVTMDDSKPFGSFPSMRHRLGYDLSFADGHVDAGRFQDPQTLQLAKGEAFITSRNTDWLRFKQITTTR